MNSEDSATGPAAPSAPPSSAPTPASTPPTTRPAASPAASRPRGGALALAILLSLLAAAAAGYVAWQQWKQGRVGASTAQVATRLAARMDAMESTLKSMDEERRTLRDRLRDADEVNRGMRGELLGQNERLRNLEDAVAKLSEKTLSGRDAMLLDETESLLRMGAERYTLFHDAKGAAAAYALADQALAAVDDGAFSGLRQDLAAEREALLKHEGVDPKEAIDQLQQLRAAVDGWSLRPLDVPGVSAGNGVWARIKAALANVVSIQRDNGAPLAVADARLARELAALDLAQAQAALLAHDPAGYSAALKRVDAALAAQFDPAAESVKQARSMLAGLLATARPSTPVQLGAALKELRNLRAVHALKPTADRGSRPARASAPAAAEGRK